MCVLSRGCAYAWISSLTLLWGIGPSYSANCCCCTPWRKMSLHSAGSSLSIVLKLCLWRLSCIWTVTRNFHSLPVCHWCVLIVLHLPYTCALQVFHLLFNSHHSCKNQCGQPQWCSHVEDPEGPFCQESAEECAFSPGQREGGADRIETSIFPPWVTKQPASWVAQIHLTVILSLNLRHCVSVCGLTVFANII